MVDLKDIYKWENQRVCFDLDNTLVSFPKVNGDYSTVEPIQKNIDALKFLYNMGHHIIIYTARRMRTHNGDIQKAIDDIGEITKQKLEEFGVPYHELVFGKPYAHYYIDDLSLNPYSTDIGVVLGLDAVKPRKFNNIVFESDRVIKSAVGQGGLQSLQGEKHWYRNIPDGIGDLFPSQYEGDRRTKHDKETITLDKIDGVTFTSLLLGESLTPIFLNTLLESIERIHSAESSEIANEETSKSLMYYNYMDKVVDRFVDYDYSKFKNSTGVFRQIVSVLKEYEEKDLGQFSVIHGDPVFSNVLLTSSSSIKLIDMRGQLGSYKTIMGDKFYDYAKIYQSLTGYDYILIENMSGRTTPLKAVFENYFTSHYGYEMLGYLRYLTASLYFSLIPLHDNEKCEKFYDCIFDLIEVS